MSRWTAADPPLAKGDYLPGPDDLDTDHGYYWQYLNDKAAKLPGMGGVYNYINLDGYHYAGQNPVRFIDPDGNAGAEVITGLFQRYGITRADEQRINQKAPAYIEGMAAGYVDEIVGVPVSSLAGKTRSQKLCTGAYNSGYEMGKKIGSGQNIALFAASLGKYGLKEGTEHAIKMKIQSIMKDPAQFKSYMTGYGKGLMPEFKPTDLDNTAEVFGYAAAKMGLKDLPGSINNLINKGSSKANSNPFTWPGYQNGNFND